MDKIIDITLLLSDALPIWPGSIGFQLSWQKKIKDGNQSNNSYFSSDSHIGTHIDAPYHFITGGDTIDMIQLEKIIGPCHVIELNGCDEIGSEELESAFSNCNAERLLIKTDNSFLWKEDRTVFNEDFIALAPDAAHWLVDRNIQLIGIDYLSIGSFLGGVETHKILLKSGITVIEGLNLYDVVPGEYELICLPLKIKGAEAAPVRAILRK